MQVTAQPFSGEELLDKDTQEGTKLFYLLPQATPEGTACVFLDHHSRQFIMLCQIQL